MSTEIDLTIGGMTCASCANRVERKLNKLDGVVATVNYATEKAHVSYPDGARPGRARRGGRGRGLHGRAARARARAGAAGPRPGPCATASSSSRRWPCR